MRTWRDYGNELTGFQRRLFVVAADDYQRLGGNLGQFADRLAADGADAASVDIEAELIGDALAWAAAGRALRVVA